MTMIKILDKNDFVNEMLNWEQNKFSAEALKTIFDIEEEINDEYKRLDKSIIYSSYHEYENEQELLDDYKGCDTMVDIENQTSVWKISDSGGLLINPF